MKPLTITSPSGAKTHFDYDRYGNLLTQTLPDGNQITFDYLEQTGLVRCFTDTLGNQWHYEYDDREALILNTTASASWLNSTCRIQAVKNTPYFSNTTKTAMKPTALPHKGLSSNNAMMRWIVLPNNGQVGSRHSFFKIDRLLKKCGQNRPHFSLCSIYRQALN
ncbi:RHS repeat domain-containing protein [Rodentibacter caecimuris]|uniref:RHS repeat domain-containing protein n=1 Tax=Rodentibacter caecimuris TaxID=1796644 RepID=UPI002FF7BB4F|nr:RHS repeat protein [Rodentibacter heylii]